MIDHSKPTYRHIDTVGYYQPFTKSNGTILARIYERLTKASRRRAIDTEFDQTIEAWYRQGVYDTLKTLQQELA